MGIISDFLEKLKWLREYKQEHPKANKAALEAALRFHRMKKVVGEK